MTGRLGTIIVSMMLILSACSQVLAEGGTFASPTLHKTASFGSDTLNVRRSVFSYTDGEDEVAGIKVGVTFTVDKPVAEVWPKFQDFNSWQGGTGIGFTGPLGLSEGKLEFMGGKRSEATIDSVDAYVVQHVIPEQLIVLHVPAWEKRDETGKPVGYRHEGIHTFMLTEVEGKTVIMGAMEQSYLFHGPDRKAAAANDIQRRVKTIETQISEGKPDVWEFLFLPNIIKAVEGE